MVKVRQAEYLLEPALLNEPERRTGVVVRIVDPSVIQVQSTVVVDVEVKTVVKWLLGITSSPYRITDNLPRNILPELYCPLTGRREKVCSAGLSKCSLLFRRVTNSDI